MGKSFGSLQFRRGVNRLSTSSARPRAGGRSGRLVDLRRHRSVREPAMTGFFGKIPAAGDFVSWNLPRSFTERWDRWFSAELLARPDVGPLDPRAWRFVVPAGVFGDQPVAGVWRMSEDRAGRRYPFVIARVGETVDPGDGWFDAAASLAKRCIDEYRAGDWLAGRLPLLPGVLCRTARTGIVFWLDDWEVRELQYRDVHDLAARGLPEMRKPRPDDEAPT
jgi:type VI secretion system protein ImpM